MSDGYPTTPRMDQRFLEAFLTPSQTTVEGYRLFPWCLKHRIWLEGIGSPFMDLDKPCAPSDVLIALQVCSEKEVGRLTLRERWLAYRLHADPARFKAACSALLAHMDTSSRWPRFWERKEEGERGSQIPWHLAVICNLVKNGVGYEHALQMPESKAIWLSTGFLISSGVKLDVLTTDDEALLDSLSKVEAEKQCPKT
jgi:hypothetical protein